MCVCIVFHIECIKVFCLHASSKEIKILQDKLILWIIAGLLFCSNIFFRIWNSWICKIIFFFPSSKTKYRSYLFHFGWIWRLIHINLFVRDLTSLLKLYTISSALFLLNAPTLFIFQYDIRKLTNQSFYPGFSSFFRVAQSTPSSGLLLRKFSGEIWILFNVYRTGFSCPVPKGM